MAFCRFSSANWRSDVYAYQAGDDQFMIHVAGLKRVGDIPDVPPLPVKPPATQEQFEAWAKAHRVQMEALEKCELVPIGGPLDGESYCEPSLEAMRDRLLAIRAAGYVVPQDALEDIAAEIAEQEAVK